VTVPMQRIYLPADMIMDLYETNRVTGDLPGQLAPGSDPSLYPVGAYVILGAHGLGDLLVGVVAEADPENMTLNLVA
jgi:hypothetical protein